MAFFFCLHGLHLFGASRRLSVLESARRFPFLVRMLEIEPCDEGCRLRSKPSVRSAAPNVGEEFELLFGTEDLLQGPDIC